MTSYAIGVMVLMVLTAVTCALPGAFLVTSRQSMLVDAMSHAAFPGIVLAALIWPIGSPYLIVGAALLALVVVIAAEAVAHTGLVSRDAAQGLLFPGLFSVGVVLLSTKFAHLHLHEDAVLVGDPNIVAVTHLTVAGVDVGPSYAYVMLAVLGLNVLFLALTHRQLSVVVFDADYARTIGLPVRGLRMVAMVLVAMTLTASFYAAGAVLVIAFVVVPAATAALFARSFPGVIWGSAGIAIAVTVPVFLATYYSARPTSSWTAWAFGLVFVVAALGRYVARKFHLARLRQGVESPVQSGEEQRVNAVLSTEKSV